MIITQPPGRNRVYTTNKDLTVTLACDAKPFLKNVEVYENYYQGMPLSKEHTRVLSSAQVLELFDALTTLIISTPTLRAHILVYETILKELKEEYTE